MMFKLFERPMYYRRVPSFMDVFDAMERQSMLQDLMFSDFDIPQMFLYFTSNNSKSNKKTKKSTSQKNTSGSENTEKSAETKEVQKTEIPKAENTTLTENDMKQEEKVEHSPKAEPKEVPVNNEVPAEQEEKIEDEKIEISTKLSRSLSDNHLEIEEEEAKEEPSLEENHSIKRSSSEDSLKLHEGAEKTKEIVNKNDNENIPEDEVEDDDEFTVETKTITKKGGFKHEIRTERNEETGVVIVTETREIGNQSMSLKRITYPGGDVEEFESRKNLKDDELEAFKAKWIKEFPNN
ncbi:hypothetical protein TVAG_399700 [Trichomonas vaginalis G3]|uniref:Uncharacterized protein n=1 Tax=Trichomonas vaginalis (strain ATCC PRA-98 / G3) TaxID=412133 RepID=A2E607_TRIV3|nr:myeloid leukemia factor family [Trichomonas vaginalis G3]EAY11964.1 hypothetical protein TVAG_399700 [Trichomonas vaginalis G3]KAI5530371.1 myeloid leukemia factor family [Trichomonas vaginalis G3]|eukprot:XP_001324187.1 hypothetical protein [Trichomonas vaginalis G3]